MNSKEASGKACGMWLKLRLHGNNFSNSANMDRPCCHVWKVSISFSNLNFSHIERVITHYQTLQTWAGLNVMHYHSLNAVPHALPHALPYIFSEIFLILGYLQCVTTRYRYFFKKNINIYFFINLMVTRGNALQIAPNHAKLRENVW